MSGETLIPEILEGENLDLALQNCELHPNGMPVVQSRDCVFQGIDTKEMSATFTIVTRGTGLNRHGNKVRIVGEANGRGIVLDNYKTNPQVLFQHGFTSLPFPIGQSAPRGTQDCTVKLYQAKADAKCYFSQVLPEAALVFALVEEGQLRTSSIGFIPLKAMLIKQKPGQEEEGPKGEPIFDLSRPWYPMDFLESDLIEWSIVDIPADPGALRKHLELGKIGSEKITDRFKPVLKQMAGEKKLVVPGYGAGCVFRQRLGDSVIELQAPTAAELRDLIAAAVKPALDEKSTQGITASSAGSQVETQDESQPANTVAEGAATPCIAGQVEQDANPATPPAAVLTAEVLQGMVTQCLQQEIGKFEDRIAAQELTLALRTGKLV